MKARGRSVDDDRLPIDPTREQLRRRLATVGERRLSRHERSNLHRTLARYEPEASEEPDEDPPDDPDEDEPAATESLEDRELIEKTFRTVPA